MDIRFPVVAVLGVLLCGVALLSLTYGQAEKVEVVGANFVPNGGFEEGEEGWHGRFTIVEEPVFQGKKACELDYGPEKKAILVCPFIPLKPRTYYKFSMAVRRTTGDGYLYVHCNYYEAPGKRLMSSKNWSAGRAMPVTVRTGEATGRWQVLSGIFRCARGKFGGVQLVIFMKQGTDVIYLDDIKIEEVRFPDAPPWKFPDDVMFPGRPSAFRMAVEDALQQGQVFKVQTTGADYTLDAGKGVLSCKQRIEATREVAKITFNASLGQLTIAKKTKDVCVIQGQDVAFGFQGDSLITIAANEPLEFVLESKIGTKHFRRTDQHLLSIDDEGGFCVMPWSRPNLTTDGSLMTKLSEDTSQPGWQAHYRIAAREMVGVAVFPPKHFDWEGSFTVRIVNTSKCPEFEALRGYRKYANVLFMFAGFYRVHPEGNCHAPYVVDDPEMLRRTIEEAHKLGMRVICYRHPTSYFWAGISVDEAIDDMKKFRAEYKFDGWYFDGLLYAESWAESYKFIRIMRESVGDGVIYTHCTLNPPVRMTEMYCPFIDAYSDFLLRGEGQTIYGPKDPYLRYVVGTYKISNSFGTLKGDKMLREGAKEPVAPPGKRLSRDELRALWREVQCPLRDQLDVMLRLNGRCRWAYPGWPYRTSDLEDYIGFYFKELDRQQAEWEKTHKPIPIRWP